MSENKQEVSCGAEAPRWKFGYGSNMNPEFLKRKKSVTALQCEPCVLKDWALIFPFGFGMACVEPSFAAIGRDPGSEVHGTVCLLSEEDCQSLDKQEGGGSAYDVVTCPVQCYNGQTLQAECYVKKNQSPVSEIKQGAPSRRYLNIIINGARKANLDPKYIAALEAREYYIPSQDTLQRRADMCDGVDPSSLPQISLAELKQRNGDDEKVAAWTGSLGYVIQSSKPWKSFKGRDITFRNILHYRGVSLDQHDDGGVSPFPIIEQLKAEELEYAKQWRDWLLTDKDAVVVGALKEFWDDQVQDVEAPPPSP